MKEALCETTGISRREVRTAVATDRVIHGVELRVVEHVERFGAELEIFTLRYVELLKQPHIEVQA